jgi:hypothetical protein
MITLYTIRFLTANHEEDGERDARRLSGHVSAAHFGETSVKYSTTNPMNLISFLFPLRECIYSRSLQELFDVYSGSLQRSERSVLLQFLKLPDSSTNR